VQVQEINLPSQARDSRAQKLAKEHTPTSLKDRSDQPILCEKCLPKTFSTSPTLPSALRLWAAMTSFDGDW
jgi:hypothetical protein